MNVEADAIAVCRGVRWEGYIANKTTKNMSTFFFRQHQAKPKLVVCLVCRCTWGCTLKKKKKKEPET